jgi:hypothetical protein
MIEAEPKTKINRSFNNPRSRVWSATLASGLALASHNTASPQSQSPEDSLPTPISQSASGVQRPSLQEFITAQAKKKPRLPRSIGHLVKQSHATSPKIKIPDGSTANASPTSEQQNLHPEKLWVPPNVSEIMHNNVVYLPDLMCSGFLIRDENDVPIGISTAQHCDLRNQDGHWRTNADGQTVLNFGGSTFKVMIGDSLDQLTSIGEVSQFLLGPKDDNTRDVALGVFAGHTAEEVAARYAEMSISNINQLRKGDVIYNSGWPVNQPMNPGTMQRQEFAMSVLGQEHWSIDNGEELQLLIAAVPVESNTGTECSWGDSGSAGFIVGVDGKPTIVGTFSAFNDFGMLYNKNKPSNAAAEQDFISNTFGVDMTGYSGVCGFSFEEPSVSDSLAIPVASTSP